MHDRRDTEELKAQANARASQLLGKLGVDMRRQRGANGYIAMLDPIMREIRPSLVIWTKMPGGVSWRRYGADAQGDIIDLISYLSGWWHLPKRGAAEAIRWIRDELGLERMTPQQKRDDIKRARRRIENEGKAWREQQKESVARAFKLWLDAKPIAGTPVETYLREARGIDLAELPKGPRGGDRTPSVLRYLADHQHRDEAGARTAWPCMVAGCINIKTGKIEAVHRTWLKRDGSDKAPVAPARKVWPGFAGLIIPIWRGESGLSVKEAAANGLRETLAIVEGVEDGLSLVLGDPTPRVWAAISLGNIANIRLPECIDGVIIHRQNDWLKRAAVNEFNKATRALEAQGRPVSEVHAFHGKDLNDTLRSA